MECLTTILEHRYENEQSHFVKWVASKRATAGGAELVEAVQEE